MNKVIKRILAATLISSVLFAGSMAASVLTNPVQAAAATSDTWAGKTPKYIFLFIGDGMSYPQFSAASDYMGQIKNEGKKIGTVDMSFMDFPVAGTATTFDSTSFCPDSASTATSISTGHKTYSGVVNMDETKTVKYETIAEKLKKQLGYKIGVVSSVSIDHATPAAFYAHQPTRSNYYDIALELSASGFEYFAGGGFLQPTGKNKTSESALAVAANKGYAVADSKEEILALNSGSGKVIAVNPELDSSKAMPYELDRASGTLALSDFVRKGIDVLQNPTGFFMMVEGGKIDWACHANDAMASIQDTVAFSEAVDEAIAFAGKHPDETLILVTGDHETGGLTIGYAATGYSTYLDVLSEQSMTYDSFDDQVEAWRTAGASFESVLDEVKANFGLMTARDPDAANNQRLVLSEYEEAKLLKSFQTSMMADEDRDYSDEETILYGSYDPFTVTLTHILNNKAGIGWTSYSHTGVPVAVFAQGLGEDLFNGYYDNTDIFYKLQTLTDVK